jgi:hypothetical protein
MIYGPKSCLVVTLARWAVPTGSGDQIPPKSRTNTAFVAWYLWKRELGAVMFRIIYCLLLLGISICSMASVVWVLSFLGFELLLVAGGCVIAFASSVTLLEELLNGVAQRCPYVHRILKGEKPADLRCRHRSSTSWL